MMNAFEKQKQKLAEIIPPAPDNRMDQLASEIRDLKATVRFLSAVIQGMRIELGMTTEQQERDLADPAVSYELRNQQVLDYEASIDRLWEDQ